MNAIRRGLVKCSGHVVHAGVPDSAYAGLTKVGAAILLASGAAAVNFALFSWVVLGAGLPDAWRIALTAVGGVAGIAVVLAIDRAMVYFADTAGNVSKGRMFWFVVLRISLILAIGAFSSQAVMPLLLKSELTAHALKMRETSDLERKQKLNQRYDVSKLEVEGARRLEVLRSTEAAVNTLPVDISQRLASARVCQVNLAAQRRALANDGVDYTDIKARLAAQTARCNQQQSSAVKERDQYLSLARKAHTDAQEAARNASTARDDANATVAARLSEAANIEQNAITITSSDVLWSLLRSSPGALGKWSLLTFLQVVLELLPLLLKFNAGQSRVGRRISVDYEIERRQIDQELAEKQQEHEMFEAVREIARMTTEKLPQSLIARQIMEDETQRIFASLAPMESVGAILEGVAQQQSKVDRYISKYPQHARVFAQTMAAAIQRASEAATAGGKSAWAGRRSQPPGGASMAA